MTQQEISDRIRKISWVLEHEPDLSQNRVMQLAGEWKGLQMSIHPVKLSSGKHSEDVYETSIWTLLHRLRGIR